MKKALSIALILLLAISVVANYQISFAAPGKDKDNNSNAIHLKDKDDPSKGNNPKVGNDDGSVVVGPDESYDLDTKDDNIKITQPGKNKGGVNKVEVNDEDGKKINSKNFKDNGTKDPEVKDPEVKDPEVKDPEVEVTEGEDSEGEDSEGEGTPAEQNIQTSTSNSLETTEIPTEQQLIPLGSPEITDTTTITNEEVPEATPQAPAPATLPKTGNIDPISITGLGTAMLAIGILLQTKKK